VGKGRGVIEVRSIFREKRGGGGGGGGVVWVRGGGLSGEVGGVCGFGGGGGGGVAVGELVGGGGRGGGVACGGFETFPFPFFIFSSSLSLLFFLFSDFGRCSVWLRVGGRSAVATWLSSNILFLPSPRSINRKKL